MLEAGLPSMSAVRVVGRDAVKCGGCAFSFEMENPAKELGGVTPTVKSTICTSCEVGEVVPTPMHGKVMKVSRLDFDPVI